MHAQSRPPKAASTHRRTRTRTMTHLSVCERRDDVAERRQAGVDLLTLLQAFACRRAWCGVV
jgi:hypothetical protein